MNFIDEVKDFGEQVLDFPWEDKDFYASFCAQTYYYVLHSTRILALTGARFSFNQERLHKRFMEHAGEEKNHEILALRDVKAMGKNIEDIEEFCSTQSFYEIQYAKAEMHPESVLGFILALEGLAVEVGSELEQRINNSHGKEACSFIRVHANEDPSHYEKAVAEVEKLDELAIQRIQKGFKQSINLYLDMLKDCSIAGCSRLSKAS